MNLTDDQRCAADRLLAAQKRRGRHLSEREMSNIAWVLAARKVEVFNARFAVGVAVMYPPCAGEDARQERVFRAARVEDGRAVVELAGVKVPVDVDQCYGVHVATASAPEVRQWSPAWLIATGVALGVLLAVVAMMVSPATAVSPERIVIDCYEPGEEPGAVVEQANRRRT